MKGSLKGSLLSAKCLAKSSKVFTRCTSGWPPVAQPTVKTLVFLAWAILFSAKASSAASFLVFSATAFAVTSFAFAAISLLRLPKALFNSCHKGRGNFYNLCHEVVTGLAGESEHNPSRML